MPVCVHRIRLPVRAETFTGVDRNNIVCTIGKRTDIKHFVSISHLRLYPIPIEVSVQIASDPRALRFEQHEDHREINVDDSEWWITWVVDDGETFTGFVGLRSLKQDGREQSIEVGLEVLENDAEAPVSFGIAVFA